jgi:hypothetical protein
MREIELEVQAWKLRVIDKEMKSRRCGLLQKGRVANEVAL